MRSIDYSTITKKSVTSVTLLFVFINTAYGQFYNKEIKGQILVEQNSEFYSFAAAVLNSTPVDRTNLRYEFTYFVKDSTGKVINKSNRTDRFVLGGDEKKVLTRVTINYSFEDHVTLLLLIYDKNDKPIGKDIVDLKDGGKTKLNLQRINPLASQSNDVAPPQDGYFFEGSVLQKTLTKSGRDFYRYFYSDYYNRQIRSPKNILIKEVPSRGRNTLITVEVDRQLVWQFIAQPRKEFLTNMATTALFRVTNYLNKQNQQKQQLIRY